MIISTNLKQTTMSSTIVLAFGPQPMDFISKANKIVGKDAVLDQEVARMAGAMAAIGMPKDLAALRQRLEAGALAAQAAATPAADTIPGAIQWLASGERGSSSEALFTRLSGIATHDDDEGPDNSHPRDPADFRRCRLMLEACPTLQAKLAEARDLSPTWRRLIDDWSRLCALMDKEAPNWRKPNSRAGAPRLYIAMEAIIHQTT